MGYRRAILILLSVALVFASRDFDDDLQFEEVDGSQPHTSSTAAPISRKWGVPDYQATVGRLFKASIPSDAFSGDIEYFEVAIISIFLLCGLPHLPCKFTFAMKLWWDQRRCREGPLWGNFYIRYVYVPTLKREISEFD